MSEPDRISDREMGIEPGPWNAEPNRVEFWHAGLPCLILRNRGPLCGYVAVPPGHPLHGRGYEALSVVVVHGGLTYAGTRVGDVCHVPAEGEPDDVWWFGFDCSHCGDYRPRPVALKAILDAEGLGRGDRQVRVARTRAEHDWRSESYKGIEYVRAEVERLAEQLAGAGGGS